MTQNQGMLKKLTLITSALLLILFLKDDVFSFLAVIQNFRILGILYYSTGLVVIVAGFFLYLRGQGGAILISSVVANLIVGTIFIFKWGLSSGDILHFIVCLVLFASGVLQSPKFCTSKWGLQIYGTLDKLNNETFQKCPKCNAKIDKKKKFCTNCGNHID